MQSRAEDLVAGLMAELTRDWRLTCPLQVPPARGFILDVSDDGVATMRDSYPRGVLAFPRARLTGAGEEARTWNWKRIAGEVNAGPHSALR